jgi:hypothetical protein
MRRSRIFVYILSIGPLMIAHGSRNIMHCDARSRAGFPRIRRIGVKDENRLLSGLVFPTPRRRSPAVDVLRRIVLYIGRCHAHIGVVCFLPSAVNLRVKALPVFDAAARGQKAILCPLRDASIGGGRRLQRQHAPRMREGYSATCPAPLLELPSRRLFPCIHLNGLLSGFQLVSRAVADDAVRYNVRCSRKRINGWRSKVVVRRLCGFFFVAGLCQVAGEL